MKYQLNARNDLKHDLAGTTMEIIWDYQNPTRRDDQWLTMLDMKDWLQEQFGLNRGYRFYRHNEMYSYIRFENPTHLTLFKVVFG